MKDCNGEQAISVVQRLLPFERLVQWTIFMANKPFTHSSDIMNRSIFRSLVVVAIFGTLASGSFAEDCQSMNFSSLAQADRMRIASNHDKTLRVTTDQTEIAALVKFVSARTDGWCKPLAGIPIGLARAELYADKTFLGAVSLGSNFAGAGKWRVRALEKTERDELLQIFAVSDPYAK